MLDRLYVYDYTYICMMHRIDLVCTQLPVPGSGGYGNYTCEDSKTWGIKQKWRESTWQPLFIPLEQGTGPLRPRLSCLTNRRQIEWIGGLISTKLVMSAPISRIISHNLWISRRQAVKNLRVPVFSHRTAVPPSRSISLFTTTTIRWSFARRILSRVHFNAYLLLGE